MAVQRLKYRDLRRILAAFGISEHKSRGKGSHRMFVRLREGRKQSFPCMCHNEGMELSAHIVAAARRCFELTEAHGISDADFYGR